MSAAHNSCLYAGVVRHQRRDKVGHGFGYRLFSFCLDLDEIPVLTQKGSVLAPRWWKPIRFVRGDYLGGAGCDLADSVRNEVARLSGERPVGSIRMWTSLRTFGYAFNPVTFYYCHRPDGRLHGVLAQITNTPWGQRHCYWTPADGSGERAHARMEKAFHVSPFQPMGQEYEWRFSSPGEALTVHMQNREGGEVVFEASLSMQRAPLDAPTLRRLWMRHPWTTAKVILAIHWNAVKLWWKGATFHAHPDKRKAAA